MNGLKQSDPGIVPLRAANKGTSVPAEPTEGRAGTKGNSRGQSTHRTQRRARVTQAAERIRQAATDKLGRVAAAFWPPLQILHPWPEQRSAVKHPR